MAAVKIRPPRDARCRAYRDHLRDRVDQRQFLAPMAIELDGWLKSNPEAPDLEEAPKAGTNFSIPSPSAVKANALRPSSRSTLQVNLNGEASIWINGSSSARVR